MKTRYLVALCLAIASAPTISAAQQVDMTAVNNMFNECIDVWKKGGTSDACDSAQQTSSGGGS